VVWAGFPRERPGNSLAETPIVSFLFSYWLFPISSSTVPSRPCSWWRCYPPLLESTHCNAQATSFLYVFFQICTDLCSTAPYLLTRSFFFSVPVPTRLFSFLFFFLFQLSESLFSQVALVIVFSFDFLDTCPTPSRRMACFCHPCRPHTLFSFWHYSLPFAPRSHYRGGHDPPHNSLSSFHAPFFLARAFLTISFLYVYRPGAVTRSSVNILLPLQALFFALPCDSHLGVVSLSSGGFPLMFPLYVYS